MLEVVETAYDHFATGGGTVVFEHREQGLEEEREIGVGESGFLGECGGDVAFGGIESVGDNVLVAHGALLLGVFFLGDSAAGDRDFKRRDGVEGLAEGELHGAAHLAEGRAFEHAVTGRDNATKGAEIEELTTKPLHGCLSFLIVGSLGQSFGRYTFSLFLLCLDDSALFDEDVVTVGGGTFANGRKEVEEVTDLSFEADVGD